LGAIFTAHKLRAPFSYWQTGPEARGEAAKESLASWWVLVSSNYRQQ